MRAFFVLCAMVALVPLKVLAQQTPPLVSYGVNGWVTLPSGWRACGTQAEGMRVAAPQAPGGAWSVHAPPFPSELSEGSGNSDRPRPYQVYVRAIHAEVQPLCMPTVLTVLPKPPLAVSSEETATGLRITLESDDFITYPRLTQEAGSWLPVEVARRAGAPRCEGKRCVIEVPVPDPGQRKELRATVERMTVHEYTTVATELESRSEEPMVGGSVVTIVPSRQPSDLTAVLSAEPARRRIVKLPASLLACSAETADISDGGKTLTLKDKALKDRRLALQIVRTADFPACPKTAEGALDSSKLKAVTLQLEAPTFRSSDLNPSSDVALDWSPDDPSTLLILVRSQLLAERAELHTPLRIRIAGVSGLASLAGPCDAVRRLCTYALTAETDWKSTLGLSLQLVAPTSDVTAMRAEGDVLDEDVFWAADGLPLETGVPFFKVSQWLADRSTEEVALSIPPTTLQQQVIQQDLTPKLARFLQPGSAECQEGSSKLQDCVSLEPLGEASPAMRLQILSRSPAVVTALTQGKILKVSTALQSGVTLIHRVTWASLANPFVVTVRKLQCDYNLQQLTRTFESLRDGYVYFQATRRDTERCQAANSWVVSTSEAGVTLLPGTESRDGEVLRIHFAALPALTTRTALDIPLSFFWDTGKTLPAATATLRVEPLAQARTSVAANVLSTPFGMAGAAPVTTGNGARPPLPMAQLQMLAVNRANWVRVDVPHPHNWLLELVGVQARPCHATRTSERGRPLLPFREGLVCLVGVTVEEKAPSLEGTLVGTLSEFSVPGAPLPEKLKNESYILGSQTLTLPATKPLRLALPLNRFMSLAFGDPSAPLVVVKSHAGPRAVRWRDSPQTRLLLHLPLSPFAVSLLPKTSTPPASDAERLHLEQQEQRLLALALEEWGPLEARFSLETLKDAGASWSASTVVAPVGGNVRLGSAADLHGLGAQVKVKADSDELEIALPFDPFQGGQVKVEDYGEMRIGLQHTPAANRFVDPSTGADPELAAYQGHVRWIMPPGPPFFRDPGSTGIGLRSRLSLSLPVGFIRTTRTGYGAKSSGDYRRLETATFGVGALYVLEKWDYNRNTAHWLFNPQVHLGMFFNTKLNDVTQTPRPSLTLGLGLRLPGGTAPTSAVEYSNGLMLWGELTRGQRQSPQLSLLFGFSVQLGPGS